MKKYYPTMTTGCNPIHPVTNWAYVRKLIRAARSGADINPILIEGSIGNGSLLAGTHRAAANDLMVLLGGEALIPVVSLDEIEISDDLQAALDDCDYEMIDQIWDRKND